MQSKSSGGSRTFDIVVRTGGKRGFESLLSVSALVHVLEKRLAVCSFKQTYVLNMIKDSERGQPSPSIDVVRILEAVLYSVRIRPFHPPAARRPHEAPTRLTAPAENVDQRRLPNSRKVPPDQQIYYPAPRRLRQYVPNEMPHGPLCPRWRRAHYPRADRTRLP